MGKSFFVFSKRERGDEEEENGDKASGGRETEIALLSRSRH